jgi:hypothetical protein
MTDEQSVRIAIQAFLIGLLPVVAVLICRYLGDNGHAQENWRYALGRMVGFFLRDMRRWLNAARQSLRRSPR